MWKCEQGEGEALHGRSNSVQAQTTGKKSSRYLVATKLVFQLVFFFSFSFLSLLSNLRWRLRVGVCVLHCANTLASKRQRKRLPAIRSSAILLFFPLLHCATTSARFFSFFFFFFPVLLHKVPLFSSLACYSLAPCHRFTEYISRSLLLFSAFFFFFSPLSIFVLHSSHTTCQRDYWFSSFFFFETSSLVCLLFFLFFFFFSFSPPVIGSSPTHPR